MLDIALVMMVKNEEGHIGKTLQSVPFVPTFVILDTGSTDNTIAEIKAFCAAHRRTLHLREAPFVNFEVSRNALLEFAEEVAKETWFLLMDASDEFRGNMKPVLRAASDPSKPCDGIYLYQQWKFAKNILEYRNCRCVKARVGWRYKGAVHEFITKENAIYYSAPKDVYLYQDRTSDGGKSAQRFHRDYELLKEAVEKDPQSSRDMFYLARTAEAIGKIDEAIDYYQRRTQLGGFTEEIFIAWHTLGNLHRAKKMSDVAPSYWLKAFAYDHVRVEPLNSLAQLLLDNREWHAAYLFLTHALTLSIPDRMLFVDKRQYEYMRYHLMGICAYYVGAMNVGRQACKRAIQNSLTEDERKLNESNLTFYTKK